MSRGLYLANYIEHTANFPATANAVQFGVYEGKCVEKSLFPDL